MGSHMLDQERSHTVAHHFIYMHVLLSKPSLPLFSANAYSRIPHRARWRRYGFLHSLFLFRGSDLTVWLGFGLLKSTLSPHQTCSLPAEKPGWLPLRKCCFFTHAGYKVSSRRMVVGKKEQLWGLWSEKTASRTLTNNKEQRLDHQGIVEVLVCFHISCLLALLCNFKGRHFDFVLWLCVITQVPNEVRTPSFKFQTPRKGICLAQAQNPITTAVIDIWWYL